MPVSLAGDTGYSEGSLRELLEERNLTADIPIHTKQENSMVAKGDFVYHGDHLSVPRARCCIVTLSSNGLGTYQHVARTRDCQSGPIKETCLPPRQKRRYFTLTMYRTVQLRTGVNVAGVKPSWKRSLLPWTVWDGHVHGCVDYGRWTASVTWRHWPTTC